MPLCDVATAESKQTKTDNQRSELLNLSTKGGNPKNLWRNMFERNLSKAEIGLYFAIYGVFLLYGIANIFSLRDKLTGTEYVFSNSGWFIIGRERDDSNYEWEIFKSFLLRNYVWFLVHISSTEICRLLKPTLVPVTHALLGLAFLLASYQTQTILIILCQLLTFYLVSKFSRPSMVWILAGIWLAVMHILKNSTSIYQGYTYIEFYEFMIAMSWCVLKCVSFSLSKISCRNNIERDKLYDYVNFCGYCLYFPTMIHGPFMVFDRYKSCASRTSITIENFGDRAKKLVLDLLRIIAWLLLTDFALHFIYVFYLEQDVEIVKTLNPWALYGFGYLMGQFFHCIYVVSYGVGISVAAFDRINPPRQPKCIGRIHFYSDMWKYFDQGLYEFLFLYIYGALCTKTCSPYKKFFASMWTFIFIYIWHGLFDYVLIWSALNFICLNAEKLFKFFIQSKFYKESIAKNLSSRNQKRLYALLGSQIFIPASISNFYFFAGVDVGNYFMQRTYQSGIFNYLGLTVCCYCIFQSAEFINEYDSFKSADEKSYFYYDKSLEGKFIRDDKRS